MDRCGHCGREGTLHSIEPSITLSSRATEEPTPQFAPEETTTERRLQIWKCSVCGEPTLRQYYWNDLYSDPADVWEQTTIYPREHEVTDLPDQVSRRYSEMMQVLFQPDSFAVGAGRLLEAVCADRGITHGTLHRRLEQLAASGDLPDPLANQALLVKEYRNIGGHDDDREITPQDTMLIRGFVDGLLEYLYWGPEKYRRALIAFEKRQASRDTQSGGR
ncbi:MAG TPA: DUF4145 domain-containing protein [Conexibacter sp.]|jgi:hypothetical protein